MTRKLILALLPALVLAGLAEAGPLYDPFLEGFQVGAYRQDIEVDRETGFPADLMTPATLDTVWLQSALHILRDEESGLTRRLLTHLPTMESWLPEARESLIDLLEGRTAPSDPSGFLAGPRAAHYAFNQHAAGDLEGAATTAAWLVEHAEALGLTARHAFVWELRARHLAAQVDDQPVGPSGPWESFLDLAPWDRGNAWALWRAQARHFNASLLPPHVTGKEWAGRIAGLYGSDISPIELDNSAFSDDFKAGLGGVLFKGGELAAHFDAYPDPPADFSAQGWWTRGQRSFRKGKAEAYEKLASNPQLSAGWRMDVWRRASERRLLERDWEEGIRDLKVALTLGGNGSGSKSLRRRLRQWAEQALVLALSEGRTGTALEIREFGLARLQGDERDAFLAEVGHWDTELGLGEPEDPGTGLKEAAAFRIATGNAPEVVPSDAARARAFKSAADTTPWPLWFRWGYELSDPEPVSGEVRERAILYRDAVTSAQDGPKESLDEAALALIALRFGNRPETMDALLRQAFQFDVAARSGGSSPGEPSGIPTLEGQLKGSELDRHALLGLALAAGDMRGILAVAVNLSGRGLAPEEKMPFLYPLPAEGVIHESLVEARSDPALVLAVARNESLFEPSVRSRAGALGFMQIMPFHYPDKGARPGRDNWSNPALSISRGDAILVENRRRHDGNPYKVLADYNAGATAANRWEKQLGPGRTRAMYLAWIGYPETRHYVEKVLIDREIYDAIIRGFDTE